MELRRKAHRAVDPEMEREEANIREKKSWKVTALYLLTLMAHTHTHCLGQNTTKPLNH